MVFWIFIGLIVLAWLIFVVIIPAVQRNIRKRKNRYYRSYDYGDASFNAGMTTFVLAFVGFLVVLIGAANGLERTLTLTEYGLHALVTKESTETHAEAVFFLGFGYASSDSTQVSSISFIKTAADGGNTIQKVDISESVIYEDLSAVDEPYMEVLTEKTQTNGWWIPWTVTGETAPLEYRFHIPDGSIYEGYEVNP